MKEFRSNLFEGTAREILRGSRRKFSRSAKPPQQDRWEALPKVSCFRYAQTMATGTPRLTLEEFEHRYAGQDTVYEYWFGEAVPRVGHTTLHGVTQAVVARLLDELGYFTSVVVDLHISPQWRPKPDVLVSTRTPEEPYPTRPDD